MNLIIIGPQGSGKGVYSRRLESKYGIKAISPGQLFREEFAKGSEIGKKANEYMTKGILVPLDITLKVILPVIKTTKGFVLDGFPRDLEQAKALDQELEKLGKKIDYVLFLEVPEDVLIKRLSTRTICPKCGEIFNTITLKPKVEGICDKCVAELIHREDDNPEAIKQRLKISRKETEPLIEYYNEKETLMRIDSDRPPEPVIKGIAERLGLE